ncbi:MAG: TolC family protein [Bacteroidota bacterium]
MRLKGLFFILFCWPLIMQAQTDLTLEECVAYALKNNEQLKSQALEKDIATSTIGETRSIGLPQVNATAGFQDNLKIQTIVFNVGDDSVAVIPAGTPVSGNANVSLSQMIFNGSYFVGLQAANALKDLTYKEYLKNEIDVVEAVSKAYYLVLVSDENLKLISANYNRIKDLYDETYQLQINGFVEKVDVSRLKVQLNNLQTSLKSSRELLEVSKAALKLQMGMPVETPISLSESLDQIVLEIQSIPLQRVDPVNRIEYSILQENRNLALLDIKNNQVQYIPTIYASFNVGWNTGAVSNFGDLWKFEEPNWIRYTNWGLSLNVPIFDGLLKKYKIQTAKAKLNQVEFGMSQLENSFKLEEMSARTNLNNALDDYTVQKENVALAEEIFDISKIKYQEGVGSNREVIDADTEWKTAQTNYFNALYNALVAKIDLEKTLGILK